MRIVEAYEPRTSVEAHCVQQLLEEAGIKSQITGEQLASLYGMAAGWNTPSILVAEEDMQRARQLIADQLGPLSTDPPPKRVFQYGMRSVLINFTLIAIIFGFYVPLGSYWPGFAYFAFLWLFLGNVMVFAYVRNKRRQIVEGKDSDCDR